MADIFANLGANTAGKILPPGRLFRSLPNKAAALGFPRDIQSDVWEKWFARRTERDLVLKMNTGSGKTVVGLLILQSSLNEGVGPAIYLVPDLQLLNQVIATAKALGLAHTTEPHDAQFRSGDAILIVTAKKLFNGRSAFGVRGGNAGTRIKLGSIVVDDAHACLPIMSESFGMTIPRDNPKADGPYARMLKLFKDDLRVQSRTGTQELVSGTGSAVVPIPYWSWRLHLNEATAVLSELGGKDPYFFSWPLIKEQLALCDAAFAPTELQLQLPHPYLQAIPSFVEAERRIYMTATLADDSVLVADFGADPAKVISPITPDSASDLGDRMILTPLETSRLVSGNDVKDMAREFAKTHNVVVIAPSKYRANEWKPWTTEIHTAKTIVNCVDRLKGGHVGLVVLIAKYDGVDLPGDACRILIIDGVPERYSPLERVEAAAIGDVEAMRTRQIQRIEQGMGRGVRSTTDYCAVILLDPRLVGRLYQHSDIQLLSPGTRAQLALSNELSDGLRGKGIDDFRLAIQRFLDRDPGWTTPSKARLDGLAYDAISKLGATTVAERKAFESALAGNYREAFETLQREWGSVSDALERGWVKQRAAGYLDQVDPTGSITTQKTARIDNNYLLSVADIPYVHLSAHAEQSAAAVAHMSSRTEAEIHIYVQALLADLVPVPTRGSFDSFESALREIGRYLGFASDRPDKRLRRGPDNLWAIGPSTYLVIECKSEAVTTAISKHDLGQLGQAVEWFDEQYIGSQYTRKGVLIHPSRVPAIDATAQADSRSMTFDHLEKLRAAIADYTQAILLTETLRNPASVARALLQFGLTGGQLLDRWTGKFAKPKVV
jgi:hypothetical protein